MNTVTVVCLFALIVFAFTVEEGDIVLTEEKAGFVRMQNENGDRSKRQAYNFKKFPYARWTADKPIPYRFNSEITPFVRFSILQGLKYWQDHTCLTFAENENEVYGLTFIKGIGCYSNLGKNTGEGWQSISIGENCDHHGIIVHEIAHALGFIHAHCRHDRDDYVIVDLTKVSINDEVNYIKYNISENDNLGVEYDYGSITHYSGDSVLKAKDPKYEHTMGNRINPSYTDFLLMNKLYGCLDKCANFPGCKNYGFRNPANCSKCICPIGFGGLDCSELAGPENGATNCGDILIANSSFGSLRYQLGNNTEHEIYPPLLCHWHIKAPAGKLVEIRVKSISNTYTNGNLISTKLSNNCLYGGVEIKHNNFTLTGSRLCTDGHIADIGTLVALVNPVIVSAYCVTGVLNFELEYRAVDASSVSANKKFEQILV